MPGRPCASPFTAEGAADRVRDTMRAARKRKSATPRRRIPRLLALLAVTAPALAGFTSLDVVAAPPASAAASTCAPDPVLCPNRLYVGASVPGLPGDQS